MTVGPGEFISDDPLQLNEWTTVIAERNRNDGSLIVNEATAVKGLSRRIIMIIGRVTNRLKATSREFYGSGTSYIQIWPAI